MALGDIVTVHLYWFVTPYGTGGLYEFLPRELGSLAFILRNIHTCCWFLLVSVLTLRESHVIVHVGLAQTWKGHNRVCISAVLVAKLPFVFCLWACIPSKQGHSLFCFRVANTTAYAHFPHIKTRNFTRMQNFPINCFFFSLLVHLFHLQVLSSLSLSFYFFPFGLALQLALTPFKLKPRSSIFSK